jgi:hypothetical protein
MVFSSFTYLINAKNCVKNAACIAASCLCIIGTELQNLLGSYEKFKSPYLHTGSNDYDIVVKEKLGQRLHPIYNLVKNVL